MCMLPSSALPSEESADHENILAPCLRGAARDSYPTDNPFNLRPDIAALINRHTYIVRNVDLHICPGCRINRYPHSFHRRISPFRWTCPPCRHLAYRTALDEIRAEGRQIQQTTRYTLALWTLIKPLLYKPRHNSRYTYADISRPYRVAIRPCKLALYFSGFEIEIGLISASLLGKRRFTNKVDLTPRICNANFGEVCCCMAT